MTFLKILCLKSCLPIIRQASFLLPNVIPLIISITSRRKPAKVYNQSHTLNSCIKLFKESAGVSGELSFYRVRSDEIKEALTSIPTIWLNSIFTNLTANQITISQIFDILVE